MTDIPELQHLLIEAAGRRSRVRRRAKGVRAVALVAAAALAVVAVPRLVTADRDTEVPAVRPPAPAAPATIESAYGVFRRPARAIDRVRVPGHIRGAETRRIAATDGMRVFLAVRREEACVVVAEAERTAMTCGPTRLFLGGYRLYTSAGLRPNTAGYALPDGVRNVTFTLEDDRQITLPVTTNGIAAEFPARVIQADWVAPDRQLQRDDFLANGLTARELYVGLNAAPGGAGELDGLRGSRRVLADGSASAWLVPRRSAVCLVLAIGDRRASGCRNPAVDTRRPIVVALTSSGGERVVAAAFADTATHFEVGPDAGISRLTKGAGALLWTDRGEARQLRYENGLTGPSLSKVRSGVEGFVLFARAEPPEAIPEEGR
jgi:hypothetical protein